MFQRNPPPFFLPVSDHRVPISYSHDLQILLNAISPIFNFSLFFAPSIRSATICLGLFRYSAFQYVHTIFIQASSQILRLPLVIINIEKQIVLKIKPLK